MQSGTSGAHPVLSGRGRRNDLLCSETPNKSPMSRLSHSREWRRRLSADLVALTVNALRTECAQRVCPWCAHVPGAHRGSVPGRLLRYSLLPRNREYHSHHLLSMHRTLKVRFRAEREVTWTFWFGLFGLLLPRTVQMQSDEGHWP